MCTVQGHKSQAKAELQAEMTVVSSLLDHSMENEDISRHGSTGTGSLASRRKGIRSRACPVLFPEHRDKGFLWALRAVLAHTANLGYVA